MWHLSDERCIALRSFKTASRARKVVKRWLESGISVILQAPDGRLWTSYVTDEVPEARNIFNWL